MGSAAPAASRMGQMLEGIKFSQDFSNLSVIWRRSIEKWFQIEIWKARAREPQPQCRAHELSIAARYLRERPKYEFVFRIAERMFPQPLHDHVTRVGSDRTSAQSRQQSPLRGDARVSRTVTRAIVCGVSRTATLSVSCSVPRTVERSSVGCIVTRI